MVNVPLCPTALVGLKRTVTVALAPAATVNGALGDTTENVLPAPRLLTVSVAFPLFETVTVMSFVCPTVTSPKTSVAGLTPICGAATAAPVPLKATVTDGCAGSLLATVSVPLCPAVLVGLNRTVTVALAPAAHVNGALGDTTKNVPPAPRLVTDSLAFPPLETV